jgi:hypothetical protein
MTSETKFEPIMVIVRALGHRVVATACRQGAGPAWRFHFLMTRTGDDRADLAAHVRLFRAAAKQLEAALAEVERPLE